MQALIGLAEITAALVTSVVAVVTVSEVTVEEIVTRYGCILGALEVI